MTKPTTRIELIHQYQKIEADLIDAASFGRPVCPLMTGDLMVLAERLSIAETAQDFIRELEKQHNQKPSGSYKGVTGF